MIQLPADNIKISPMHIARKLRQEHLYDTHTKKRRIHILTPCSYKNNITKTTPGNFIAHLIVENIYIHEYIVIHYTQKLVQ